MRRLSIGFCLVALCATAAFAGPYAGPWTKVWDFNTSTEGWVHDTGPGAWDSAAGNVYAPDGAWWYLDANSYNLGTGASRKPFVIQADVYVGATNYLQGGGIGAYRNSDYKGPYVSGGAAGGKGMYAQDMSWDNQVHNLSWGLSQPGWTKVQIDYGVTEPGKWHAYYMAMPGNDAGWTPGWVEIAPTASKAINSNSAYQNLQFGNVSWTQGGWNQARYDNFSLYVVPEPTTLVLLAVGGLALRSRRRA